VTDLEDAALAEWSAATGRRLPLFLVGVSWGGKLAAALAAMHGGRYAGVALLCPGICAKRGVSAATKWRIGRALARGRGRQRFALPFDDPRLFTATPRWREFLERDPLTLREATAQLLGASRRMDLYLAEAAPWIAAPLWLALAEHDAIIDNAATQRYVARSGATDKTVRVYAGAQHTLEFEPEPEPIFAELTDWLLRHGGEKR